MKKLLKNNNFDIRNIDFNNRLRLDEMIRSNKSQLKFFIEDKWDISYLRESDEELQLNIKSSCNKSCIYNKIVIPANEDIYVEMEDKTKNKENILLSNICYVDLCNIAYKIIEIQEADLK